MGTKLAKAVFLVSAMMFFAVLALDLRLARFMIHQPDFAEGVRAVLVEPGRKVAKGDRLALIEAMKMEHPLTAQQSGIVAEVYVKAGDLVEAGAAVVRLTDEAAAALAAVAPDP